MIRINMLIIVKVQDKSLIERHRMVYAILDEMLKKEIHALSIEARTEEE